MKFMKIFYILLILIEMNSLEIDNSLDLFKETSITIEDYDECVKRRENKQFFVINESHLVSESSILRLSCDNLW